MRIEFRAGFVEGRLAGSAGVDAVGGIVFIVFSGAGTLGAFLAEDAELFYVGGLVVKVDAGEWEGMGRTRT